MRWGTAQRAAGSCEGGAGADAEWVGELRAQTGFALVAFAGAATVIKVEGMIPRFITSD